MYRNWIFIFFFFLSFFSLFFLFTCTKDKGIIGNGYPEEISEIIVGKCATPGCHTQKSKDAAAALSLETWSDMFAGDRNGAVCVPYSHEYSTIFLFTNTFTELGVTGNANMPYNKPPLSKEEMNTLIDWIDKGAPRSDGKIAFADNPNRKKIYITNQKCDVVTVFDAATQLQMRYINVGVALKIESPHMIKVSPDGKYWYVVFSDSGTVIQKFTTSEDIKVGELNLGEGMWTALTISNNSKYGFGVNWDSNGKIAHIDLENMSPLVGSPWSDIWDAYSSALNAKGDTLYVAASYGNYIHKIPVNNPLPPIPVVLNPPSTQSTTSTFDPHHIAFSPDNLYYYVTCQKSDEVRVMRVSDDALVDSIPTGKFPQEMAFSTNPNTPYLFVTCEQDINPSGTRGSVTVIKYTTKPPTVIANLRLNMSDPHGIAVDDVNGLVYVSNRNLNAGFDPHHISNCGGTNGYISFIDLNTLQVIGDKKIELATDPYSIAVRK